jgi:hypothetical protein
MALLSFPVLQLQRAAAIPAPGGCLRSGTRETEGVSRSGRPLSVRMNRLFCLLCRQNLFPMDYNGVLVHLHVYHHTGSGSVTHLDAYRMGSGALSPGVKRPGREADNLPPSSAEVKNAETIPPFPICLHDIVPN